MDSPKMNKKVQILLDSFNTLKDNVETNHSFIAKLMAQLQGICPEEVIAMWKYMLESNWNDVICDRETYGGICYYLTKEIMDVIMEDNENFGAFEPYVLSEKKDTPSTLFVFCSTLVFYYIFNWRRNTKV